MSGSEYVDRLVALHTEISLLMDLLPHAQPLTDDQKIRIQGRLLQMKTKLDHAAGVEVLAGPAEQYRTVARKALLKIDVLSWDSEPDRKWYRTLYEAAMIVQQSFV